MKTKILLLIVVICSLQGAVNAQPANGCIGCDTIQMRYHKYYYGTEWYDSCNSYYEGYHTDDTVPVPQNVRLQLTGYIEVPTTGLYCKKMYTPVPLQVKGLMCFIDMDPYRNRCYTLQKLPEYLYLFQWSTEDTMVFQDFAQDTMILLDSVRWDTMERPYIAQFRFSANEEIYQYCYAYEAYFDKPVTVDSVFYIGGTGHSNRNSSIDNPTEFQEVNYYIPSRYMTPLDFMGCQSTEWSKQLEYFPNNPESEWWWINYHYPNVFGFFLPIVDNWTILGMADSMSRGMVNGSGYYPNLFPADLKAIPEQGFRFAHWNDFMTDNPRHITVTSDSTFVASFIAMDEYDVIAKANNAAMGMVSGGGFYHYGDTVTLLATPASNHYCFISWSDGNTDNPRTVTVAGDTAFTAYFRDAKRLTVSVQPNDMYAGTTTGSGMYYPGDTATLEATAFTGYSFAAWDDGDTANPRQITVLQDTLLIANFVSTTGIDEADYMPTLTVTPNPAHTQIRVASDEAMSLVTLRDMNGRTVLEARPNATATVLNVSQLPSGTYILTATTPRGTASRKLVVQ